MATKFYLRNITAAAPPTAGEKSSVLPADTLGANNATGTQETRLLDSIIGTSETSIAHNSDATTAARDNYLARFTSKPLGAQTIPAQTWTLAIALAQANGAANSFLILSLYIWRPGTQSVVGYIYDSHTSLGNEWGTTKDGRAVTFSGSELAIQEGDVLVLEVWRHAVQSMSAVYTQTVYFDGTVDVTEGSSTSAASYLSSPASILAPITKFITLKHDIRSLANKLSTIKYHLGGITNKAITLKYNLRQTVNKLSTLKYKIINFGTKITTVKYDLAGTVSKIISLLYKIQDAGFVSDTGIFSNFFVRFTIKSVPKTTVIIDNKVETDLAVKSVPKTSVVIDNEIETDLETNPVAKTTSVINNDYVHLYPEFIAKAISLLYNIRVFANKATSIKYNIRALVNKLSILKYHIFLLASKAISLLYNMTGAIAKLTTIKYNVREFVNRLVILKHSILVLATKLSTLKYNITAFVNKLTAIKYDVAQSAANKLVSIKYDIRTLVSRLRTIKYDVAQALVNKLVTIKWNIRELVNKENIFKYAILILVFRQTTIKYIIRQLASSTATLKYHIAGLISKLLTIIYGIVHHVAPLLDAELVGGELLTADLVGQGQDAELVETEILAASLIEFNSQDAELVAGDMLVAEMEAI